MEYTHKFSIGPVSMDKMLEEYHQLRKTRRYCHSCPNYKRYWSCPEYIFDEVIFLKEFKYMYLIAREYEVPREDRQKIFGIQRVAEYSKQICQAMKMESWKDLLDLEKEFPGTMGLIPGNCEICDISGEGCARPKGEKCRHPEMMRFSLESLGFDVDSICKYEIGVLLMWPREGHLPEKLCAVMALMTNDKIPMDRLKAHFPDKKKNWLRFSETAPEARNELRPEVKRQESWLDNMRKQNQEREEDPSYQPNKSWIGFKSASLDSGDYVKNQAWHQDDEETPESAMVEEMLAKPEMAEEAAIEPAVPEEAPTPQTEPAVEVEVQSVESDPVQAPEAPAEEEDAIKYKWLGFKRSVEEAEEKMYSRPIRKFSVSEEEAKAQEAALAGEEISENVPETLEEDAPASEALTATDEPIAVEATAEPTSEPVPDGTPAEPEISEAVAEMPMTTSETVPPEPIPAPQPTLQAEPTPQPPAEPDPVELPDRFSVADVLGAAIEIAKDVVGDEFVQDKKVFTQPIQPEKPASSVESTSESAAEEEDDSKYKWLGFKAELKDDDDGFKKGGWKKNY